MSSTRQYMESLYQMANDHTLGQMNFHPDFEEHESFLGGATNAEELQDLFRRQYEAFPDFSVELRAIYADGDTGISRLIMRGTHLGMYRGVPATGRTFEVEAISVMRFQDGMMREHWGVVDEFAILKQIGAIENFDA